MTPSQPVVRHRPMKNLILLIPLLCAGCLSADGGTAAVAQISIADVGDARFDGNVFVGHGSVALKAQVFVKESGWPLYGPIVLTEGKRLVARVDPQFRGEYGLDDPIPGWCAQLFLPGEAQSLGITFLTE